MLATLLSEVRAARARGLRDAVVIAGTPEPAPTLAPSWTETLGSTLRAALNRGIRVRDAEAGYIDVIVVVDGQERALCWRDGEASIDHEHAPSEGCGRRRRA